MFKYGIIWYITILFVIRGNGSIIDKSSFPEEFLFGVATASYQVEGAWNESDKSESIWDRYTHEHKERVFDHTTGDVSADSYHLFRKDVELMRQLGVNFYRFSISWTRVLPSGFTNYISEDGVRYYNELLDELLKYNIKPLITMYHWDLPQSLQDLGGWTNPLMADYFLDYADFLFKTFGKRVMGWITFNEPYSFCHDGYGGNDAPGGKSSGIESYLCGHNVLRAHGMVFRLYHQKYYKEQDGSIGITLCLPWMEPFSNSKDDEHAAERALQFSFGWFANPIFSKEGDYPKVMKEMIEEYSQIQNFTRSRLPKFTKGEIDMIRGSATFLGLNHYTTYIAKNGPGKVAREPTFENDQDVIISQRSDWPSSNSTWLKVVPWGFRKSLNWIRNKYDNPFVVVTENGISSEKGLTDTNRIAYMDGYLRNLLYAIHEDGCTVMGYTYWSLMDNFEWMRGYSERFGLFEVNYDSPNKTRTARNSAAYYKQIIKTKKIPPRDYSIYL